MHWIILTGEYPPQPGGVSDYTRLVAQALVAAGDEVHVWAPPCMDAVEGDRDGVTVHRLPDRFGKRSLRALEQAIDRAPHGTRVLVQYVPHAFGRKAMNLPFCIWLWRQRQRCSIDAMFHEVAYPWVRRGAMLRHNLLAATNRVMAFFVARAAERVYVSIPAWSEILSPLIKGRPVTWLPVPSNVATEEGQPEDGASVRDKLLDSRTQYLLGHFGTFSKWIEGVLTQLIPEILAARDDIAVLLVGRGSDVFAAALRNRHPALADRIKGTGPLHADGVRRHLAACDLLLQPYPDGVSTRRGTTMAGLACGVPILTLAGHLTEPVWAVSEAVSLASSVPDMAPLAVSLLQDRGRRAHLSARGRALYDDRFHLERSVAVMRSMSEGATDLTT